MRVGYEILNPKSAIIKIAGDVNSLNVNTLSSTIQELLEKNIEMFGLDLRFLKYIDSSGIREILKIGFYNKKYNKKLPVLLDNPYLKHIFRLAHLENILEYVDTEELLKRYLQETGENSKDQSYEQ